MKRALHWAGALLCVAAVMLFVRQVMDTGLRLPPGGVLPAVAWIGASGLAYAVAVGLLAWLWTVLLLDRGTPGGIRAEVAGSYLVSQFGKYLPGNVFHYLGRHVLGRRLGIGHATLASAAVFEAGFLLVAAASVIAAGTHSLPDGLQWVRLAAAAGAVAGLVVLVLAPRLLPKLVPLPWLDAGRVMLVLAAYLVFVAAFGILYALCLRLFQVPVPLVDSLGYAALGWTVGFLVPGAPAGAGLREAALALASPVQDTASVTSAIIAFRIVTMLGDFFAFIAGLGIQQWLRRRAPAANERGAPT